MTLRIIIYAFIPALFIASLFYVFDKNKEPFRIILRAFALGIVSVILIPVLYYFNPIESRAIPGSLEAALIHAFYFAAFLEEISKFFVFLVGLYFIKDFDEWYDGILYGVLIGLGFAFIENIIYYFDYLVSDGFNIVIGRSLFSMPLHALVGGVMGYFIGKAKFTLRESLIPWWLFLAFFIPFLIHGIYDFLLMYKKLNLGLLASALVFYMWIKVLKLKKVTQSGSII